jgi:hypothetical protein
MSRFTNDTGKVREKKEQVRFRGAARRQARPTAENPSPSKDCEQMCRMFLHLTQLSHKIVHNFLINGIQLVDERF